MTEKEKNCKICKVNKPISEYHARSAVCIICFNAKRRINKQKENTKMDRLIEYHEIIGGHIKEENLRSLSNMLEQMIKECTTLRNEELAIRLVWPLSPVIETFLESAMLYEFTQHEAITQLHDKTLKDAFPNVFGVNQDDAMQLTSELNKFYIVMSALDVAYNFFVEAANIVNERISNRIFRMPFVKFEYNFITKEMTLYTNPLKLSRERFMEKIKNETQGHYGLMYHHHNNSFESFYAKYLATTLADDKYIR